MATVRISFDGGNVPVVTATCLPTIKPRSPIQHPPFTTKSPVHRHRRHVLLWPGNGAAASPAVQLVQAVDGQETAIAFPETAVKAGGARLIGGLCLIFAEGRACGNSATDYPLSVGRG